MKDAILRKTRESGNGGSACDTAHVAIEFTHPVLERRRPLPALALSADSALLTAVGNDQDFANVFEQQLELLARPELLWDLVHVSLGEDDVL